MQACKKCGHQFPDESKFCPECGEKVTRDCVQCGHSLKPGEKFCSECGCKVGNASNSGEKRITPQVVDEKKPTSSAQEAIEAYENEDYATAMKLASPLANQGDAIAQRLVAMMYFGGDGVEEDGTEGFKWLMKSVEQGDPKSQYFLGIIYNGGAYDGIDKDEQEAFKWFLKSAEQGNSDAQMAVGSKYYTGEGVKENEKEGILWFIKSAVKGNDNAQAILGKIYLKGAGVEKDVNKGLMWLRKAAEQGNEDAQADLKDFLETAESNNDAPTSLAPSAKGIKNDSATEVEGNKIWETVLNLALNALSNISVEKINDPVFMRKCLGKAHSLLPFYVRAVVSEETFFNFCFDRRSFLIEKISSGNTELTRSEEQYLLPSDNELPEISQETRIVNIVDSYTGKMFSEDRLYFFPGLDLEKFKVAYESYIQDALEKNGISSKDKGWLASALKATGISKDTLPEALGIPLMMYDVTAFSSCKDGFLLTTKLFIVKELMNKPLIIKLSQIESVELKKSLWSAGKIVVNGTAVIDCVQGKKESLQSFIEMLEEVLSVVRN